MKQTFVSLMRTARDAPARALHRARRARIEQSRATEPELSFGGVLEGERLVHGGAVKLLHLRKAFACSETRCNVLYLVSSAQPPFALDLVRTCRNRGIHFVWNQNGVGYPGWAGADAERHNAPMRQLRAQADFVIYQSAFCKLSAEKFLGPCSAPDEILLNPVDLEEFCPARTELPAGAIRLLAAGTQNYPERVFSTLECLKILREEGVECSLTIAGRLLWPGAERAVRQEIERCGAGDSVTLLPPFTRSEAAALYQSHHVLLHPKYLDPCPTVVIESLACGVPVVGSASGGLPELVPPSCGKLVPVPIDWERLVTPSGRQLAEMVASLLPGREAAAHAARAHAEAAFDGRDWVRRHARIFQRVLA